MKILSSLVAFSALSLSTWSFAERSPDIERELRMKAEIVDAIMDGEPVELEADNHTFMGIFTEAENAKGTVVIAHGRGFHPDWPTVVQPLRVGLVERGWNTLSIQMPVLEKSAKYFDYVEIFDAAGPRIEAAIAYAKENGGDNVVLFAHSCGSHMAQRWILNKGEEATQQFSAYVGMGMGATDYKQPMVEPFQLNKMKMPILDLYGEDDYPAVVRIAPERDMMIAEAANPKSKQISAKGATHYFVDKGDVLVKTVADWLDTL